MVNKLNFGKLKNVASSLSSLKEKNKNSSIIYWEIRNYS